MVKSRPSMKKTVITMRWLWWSWCIAGCLLTERKTKESKTCASYRLVSPGYYIVTDKMITTSPHSLITNKVQVFLTFVEESYYYYFITGKISKQFDRVRKIWLV